MLKLANISLMASPHMVRFIPYLRKYFDADFYFYEQLACRQSWWKVDLGEHGHVLPCRFKWRGRFFTLSVLKVLREKNPDIVMLGGFGAPSNYLAYLWARRHGKTTIVFTERSRNMKTGELRGYGLYWRIVRFLYRKIDRVFVVTPDAVSQFGKTFRFGDRAVCCGYPNDIDRYYAHPIRQRKDAYTLIYPNRMTDIYNPIAAVEIFEGVLRRYPKTRLKMNATGELRPMVEAKIADLGIGGSVEFLDDIRSWDELSDVYASCDIMILPAKFSNGNYTILECMVSGMACILSEHIQGGIVNGYFKNSGTGAVLPLDARQWIDRICWYIEHPEEFARITPLNREKMRPATMEFQAKTYHEKLMTVWSDKNKGKESED